MGDTQKKESLVSPVRTLKDDEESVIENTNISPEEIIDKKSILSNEDDVFDISAAFDTNEAKGTIVTDIKKKRWSLGSALATSLKSWMHDTKENTEAYIESKKPEIKKIEPATKRKEIIEKATNKSAQAPHDDHTAVIQKLRTLSHDAEQITGKPFIIKKKGSTKPAWSHTIPSTEKEKDTDLSKEPNKPVEKFYSQKSTTGEVPNDAIVAPAIKKHSLIEHETEKVEKKPPVEKIPEVSIPEFKPVPLASPVITEPVKPPQKEEVVLKEKIEPVKPPVEKRRVITSKSKNNILNQSFVIIITAILFILGGGYGILLWNQSTPETVEVTKTNVPSFFKVDTHIAVTFKNNNVEFLAELTQAATNSSKTFVQLYPIFPQNINSNTETVAKTSDIMAVISPKTSGPFIRSLDDRIMFGVHNDIEQSSFIVLKSNVFDVAFAGMLEWERNIISDFEPFFEQTSLKNFEDGKLNNYNTRILYDNEANIRLIYTFANRNTIVITTSMTSLARILEKF